MNKTEIQIIRKAQKIQRILKVINDPKTYKDRMPTAQEERELNRMIGQWEIICWLTGKYKF